MVSGDTQTAGGADGSGAGNAGCGGGLGARAAGAVRRPPGVGRITVRSLSPGSAKGLSLTLCLMVVLAEAVVLYDPFQREAVVGIGGIDAGQRVGEGIGIVHLLHRILVD